MDKFRPLNRLAHRPLKASDRRQMAVCAVAAAILLILFATLAGAVGGGALAAFDRGTIALVRTLPDPPADFVMEFATYLASWQVVVAGTVCCVIFFLVTRRRTIWIGTLIISVAGDELIVSTTKAIFARVRPDQAMALMPAVGPSFPSGHTFAALAFYGVLAWYLIDTAQQGWARRVIGLLTLALFALVGISRVYLGAHWPTDVIGSYLLGGAWLATVLALFVGLKGRSVILRPEITKERRFIGIALLGLWLGVILAMNYLHSGFTELQ